MALIPQFATLQNKHQLLGAVSALNNCVLFLPMRDEDRDAHRQIPEFKAKLMEIYREYISHDATLTGAGNLVNDSTITYQEVLRFLRFTMIQLEMKVEELQQTEDLPERKQTLKNLATALGRIKLAADRALAAIAIAAGIP